MLRASWTRRQLLTSTAGVALGAALARVQPTWAQHGAHAQPAPTGGAGPIDLRIHYATLPIGERPGRATCINGSLPGPLVRLREGENAILRVTNALDEDTSIHWHGVLVPAPMDGVPGVSFPGIRPGETFTYEFPVGQSGTYWYHSHSRLQEQTGVYGPLVIEPWVEVTREYTRSAGLRHSGEVVISAPCFELFSEQPEGYQDSVLGADAARLIGGVGSCGRELCCTTWLGDFKNVTTSAARYQSLSLNPSLVGPNRPGGTGVMG